jgi:hypothetical protein
VRIYAEDVTIGAALKVKELFLSANSVTGVNGAGVDADGQSGGPGGPDTELPGQQAKPGDPGDPAKSVTVILGIAEAAALGFSIRAVGGSGGGGQNNNATATGSKGGDGGSAGVGGDIRVFARHSIAIRLDAVRAIYRATTGPEAATAVGILADLVGPDDTAVWDSVQSMKAAVDLWTSTSKTTLTSVSEPLAWALEGQLMSWQTTTTAAIDVAPGSYGVYGKGLTNGENGALAQAGTRLVRVFVDYGKLATSGVKDLLYLHPEQCSMLLQRAEVTYFVADPIVNPTAVQDAGTFLQRLIDRTMPFADAKAGDPLHDAYNDPANQATLGSGDCVNSLAGIYARASILKQQLHQGLDYFGHRYNYAPLASNTFYDKQLSQMLGWFKDLEAKYTTYFTNLGDAQQATQQLQAVLRSARHVKATAQNDLKQLYDQASSVLTVIESYEQPLKTQHDALVQLISEFESDLKNHFDFNFSDFFSSLSTVAFAPESRWMWATQVAQIGYKFDTNIVQDDGTSVKKKYLLRQVQTVDGSIDSILEGYALADDGTLGEDDQGAAMLLADQQTLYKTLDQVYSKFPDDIDAIKQAFQTYVNTVLERNQQILNYNAIVLTIAKKVQLASDTQNRIDTVSAKLSAQYQPDLPLMTTFVSRLYYQARSQILETLYLATKAYQFWALSDENLIAQTLGGDTATINAEALEGSQVTIIGQYGNAVEGFGRDADTYPSVPSETGILLPLSKEQVQLLQNSHTLLVSIPAATKETSINTNPFAGLANVRLTKVRLWLPGAVVNDLQGNPDPNGLIRVGLTHTGKETIVAQNGTAYQFTHDPVTVMFIYAPSTKAISQDGDIGCQPIGATTTYALLGPFTWWQIALDPNLNPGLDLSAVSGASLEFHITDYAYN